MLDIIRQSGIIKTVKREIYKSKGDRKMTVKEFYEYCVARGAENLPLWTGDEFQYELKEQDIFVTDNKVEV